MLKRTSTQMGKVYLVGAGPGDPELLTVKGLRILQTAEVLLYDRLVAPELLVEVPADCEKIFVGKIPHEKSGCSQETINQLIVQHARRGKQVVRLKGGDPFIYGRGSEEALVCSDAGIPFEIVPGISSINAVPAYAGIPLTHRHISTSFTVMTGHEAPEKLQSAINHAAVAGQNGTIVILMGVNTLRTTLATLMESGLPPQTPSACIEHGTTRNQRVIVGTVAELPDCVEQANVNPPALIIIGEVVTLHDKINWYRPYVG